MAALDHGDRRLRRLAGWTEASCGARCVRPVETRVASMISKRLVLSLSSGSVGTPRRPAVRSLKSIWYGAVVSGVVNRKSFCCINHKIDRLLKHRLVDVWFD